MLENVHERAVHLQQSCFALSQALMRLHQGLNLLFEVLALGIAHELAPFVVHLGVVQRHQLLCAAGEIGC